jgi:hypothetical protein
MINEKALDERLTALEAVKTWSPRVVSRLETLLRSGADEALFRINPIRFAAERSIAEGEATSRAPSWACSRWTGSCFVRCALTSWKAFAA